MTLIVAVGAAAAVLVTLTLAVPLKPLGRLLGGITVALLVTWWLPHDVAAGRWVAGGVAGGFFGVLLQSLYELLRKLAEPPVRRPSARGRW